MHLQQRDSGLVVASEKPPAKPKANPPPLEIQDESRDSIRHFEVYHQSDVAAFLGLIVESGATLCAVNLIGSGPFNSMSSWFIFYRHTEALEMEVRT